MEKDTRRAHAHTWRTIPISEFIPRTIVGEGKWTGASCMIVRLQGCNLSCPFCDTPQKTHQAGCLDEIHDTIMKSPVQTILLTGGEPTIHMPHLQTAISQWSTCHDILLESNGTGPLPHSCTYTCISPKYKHPLHHTIHTRHIDDLKFLIPDSVSNEYIRWMCDTINYLHTPTRILLQPQLPPNKVLPEAEHMRLILHIQNTLEQNFSYAHKHIVLSLQIHKILSLP